jgi:hypothetical protein
MDKKTVLEIIDIINEQENIFLKEECDRESCRVCSITEGLFLIERILREKIKEPIKK